MTNNNLDNLAQIEYRKKLGQAREKIGEMFFSTPKELQQELHVVITPLLDSKLSEEGKRYYEQRFTELISRMVNIMLEEWGIQYGLRWAKYMDLMLYLLDNEKKAENFYFDNLMDKMLFDFLTNLRKDNFI